jgi:hypothetical protein
MTDARYRVRVAALTGGAAMGVHEARYLIAYGGHSSDELSRQGHAYMAFVTPFAVAVLALAAVQLLAAVSCARKTGSGPARRPPTWKLWLWASATLLAVYVGQETLEGLLASGHAHGLAAVFAHGGWVCAPLALSFGAIVALGLRGADLAVGAAARRARRPRPRRTRPLATPPRLDHFPRTSSPLAAKLAGRAPPGAAALA